MARSRKISGDAQLLLTVPKHAIIDRLLKEPSDSIIRAATAAKIPGVTRDDGITVASLVALSHDDMIRVFAACTTLPAGAMRILHEEHRYRGMKTLYLYECLNLKARKQIRTASINSGIVDRMNRTTEDTFSNLQVTEKERFAGPSSQLEELSYTYTAPVRYVDPKTEYPATVDDLRGGFIWLYRETRWLAICARDQAIAEILHSALVEDLGCDLPSIAFPKELLTVLEPGTEIRRATFLDTRTRTTRRYSNPRMREDTRALDEVRLRDAQDERKASGYNQRLDDGTSLALGYASRVGRIHFSKDLTVPQLRSWAPAKIETIVSEYRRLRRGSPEAVVVEHVGTMLALMSARKRAAVSEILIALARCRVNGLSEEPLQRKASALIEDLKSWLFPTVSGFSETEHEAFDACCRPCSSTSLSVRDGRVVCDACGTRVQRSRVRSVDGYEYCLETIDELIQVNPGGELLDLATKLFASVGPTPFDPDREYFYLRGSRLYYFSSSHSSVLRFEDVSEFRRLLRTRPSSRLHPKALEVLAGYREKCAESSTENCARCVRRRVDSHCFQRLFGLFDPEYTPRPHHGQEYGDYDRLATVDNQAGKRIVVMIKSGKPEGKPLRSRSTVGRDILSQFAEYLKDATKDVIGIAIPQQLDGGLRGLLVWLAERARKRVLFVHENEFVKIIANAMRAHGKRVEQL